MGDDFFSSLENTKPFLKVAFEGFAGSGKTRTMAELAIGLRKRIGSRKPIAVFDTEKAAMFLRRLFADNGIDPSKDVLYKESRTLADLKEVMRRGRDGLFDVLLIDSITHVWEDFLGSYQEQKKRTRLEFQDWSVLKPKWKREFSEPFVRDRYHALMCGRAGFEYGEERNADGKREIFKSGIKMKVEGETAYEPDMLVLMERFEEVLGPDKRVWRQATIIKDRSSLIDGKTFENPTFSHFAPAIDFLLENPTVREASEAQNEFPESGEDRRDFLRRREIALEKIEGVLVEQWPGQSAEAKRAKVEALRLVFGSTSWTEIQGMHPQALERFLEKLVDYIAEKTGKPRPKSASLADKMGVTSGSCDLADDDGPPPIKMPALAPAPEPAREPSSSSAAAVELRPQASASTSETLSPSKIAAPSATAKPIGVEGQAKAGAEVVPQEQRGGAPPASDSAPASDAKKQEGSAPSAVATPGSQKLASSSAIATETTTTPGVNAGPGPHAAPAPTPSLEASPKVAGGATVPPAPSPKGVPEATPPLWTAQVTSNAIDPNRTYVDKDFGTVFEDPGLPFSGYADRVLADG